MKREQNAAFRRRAFASRLVSPLRTLIPVLALILLNPLQQAGAAGPGNYTVTTTADPFSCPDSFGLSLRCAITDALATSGNVVISFAIPAGDPGCATAVVQGTSVPICTIRPSAPFPTVSADGIAIDGYTQPDAAPNVNNIANDRNGAVIAVRIDGAIFQAINQTAAALALSGNGDTLRGLSFTNFPGVALDVHGSNDVASGNYVGVTPTGVAGSNATGLAVSGADVIGGTTPDAINVIDANGIGIADNGGATIEGNDVGTSVVGSGALGNTRAGIDILGPGSTVGGTATLARNVISGNQKGAGISIESAASGTAIEGNLVGTAPDGVSAQPNGAGIVGGSHCSPSPNCVSVGIGGSTRGAGNVVSGNQGTGIEIERGTGARVEGNVIGLAEDGVTPLGNGGFGVGCSINGNPTSDCTIVHNIVKDNAFGVVCGVSACTVTENEVMNNSDGGIKCGFAQLSASCKVTGNTITGNSGAPGIGCSADTCTLDANTVRSNPGGISCTGVFTSCLMTDNIVTDNRGNGIHCDQYAVCSMTSNTIINNVGGAGILCVAACTISRNSIGGNAGLGIDLATAGQVDCTGSNVTPCPIIASASLTSVTGFGALGSRVEVFIATNGPHDQGHGSGATYLGYATADPNTGRWIVPLSPGQVSPGDYLTATSTEPSTTQNAGTGTSEFGANAQAPGTLPAAFAVSAPARTTSGAAVSVTVTAVDGSGHPRTDYTGTVHFASSDPRARVPLDYAFTAADMGSHTFTATLDTPREQTVTVTDADYASILGVANMIVAIPIRVGWNALNIPLSGSGITSAAGLTASLDAADTLGSHGVQAVATFSDGRFLVYVPGYTPDVPIGPTAGVLVLSGMAGAWAPPGQPYRAAIAVAIGSGWNLVGIPYPPGGLDASTIVAEINGAESGSGSVTAVSLLVDRSYQTYVPNGGNASFPVPSTAGVWIESTATATWMTASG